MPEYSTGMSQPPNGTMRAPQRDVRGVEGGFPERRSGSGRGDGVGHGGHARRGRGNLLTVLCGPRPVKAARHCCRRAVSPGADRRRQRQGSLMPSALVKAARTVRPGSCTSPVRRRSARALRRGSRSAAPKRLPAISGKSPAALKSCRLFGRQRDRSFARSFRPPQYRRHAGLTAKAEVFAIRM